MLGIDFGSKRCGIAWCEKGSIIAFPVTVIDTTAHIDDDIIMLAQEKQCETIVFGESVSHDGTHNDIHKKTLEIIGNIEKRGFTTILQPEQYTSVQAQRIQGKNKLIDASAATLILQAYIDKISNRDQL